MGSLQFFVYYNKNVFFLLIMTCDPKIPLASPCWLLGPRQFCSFSIRTSHTYWGHLASFSHQLRKPFLASLSLLPHECVTNNSLRVWCDKWPGIKEINVNINVFFRNLLLEDLVEIWYMYEDKHALRMAFDRMYEIFSSLQLSGNAQLWEAFLQSNEWSFD